jgi:uncharacterized protein involved in exopolysaccharide biosynthesis
MRKYKTKDQLKFIKSGIIEAKEKLEIVQEKLKDFREQNRGLNSPEKELELERLQTNIEVKKSVFVELSKQLEVTKIEEIKETKTLNIIEEANVQYKKVKPKRFILVILFILLGVFLSFLMIFVQQIFFKIKLLLKKIV